MSSRSIPLLTVGETSPRKGYETVLRALQHVDEGTSLVMAGPPAGDEQRLAALMAELGVEHRVTRLGSVSDQTLAWLYREATALCFPSVAEGFGFPVLEAMAAGLPVLASDIPPTRELVADAALYIPPGEEPAWAEAIRALGSDSGLRERLSTEGRRRAAGFTWERTAEATFEAYQLALAGAPGSASA